MSKIVRVWGILSLAVYLSACSVVTPRAGISEPASSWEQWQQRRADIQVWTIKGRLSVQREDDGWHAAYDWQQQDQNYRITLSAPLGQGTVILEGDELGVIMVGADGRRTAAATPEQLLQQRLGWQMPVAGLRFWVRGLPAPGAESKQGFDPAGRLAWMAQSGWHIDYRKFGEFAGVTLPIKIFLDNGTFKVRLIIDEWVFS